MSKLIWEKLKTNSTILIGSTTYRAKVLGGWLVRTTTGETMGMTFLPDPEHLWDGGSPE